MTLSKRICVVEINTLWHFRYPQLPKKRTKVVFSQTIRDWNDLPDSLISSAEMSDDCVSMEQIVLFIRQLNFGVHCWKKPVKLHLLIISNNLLSPGMGMFANVLYVNVL